MHVNVKQLVYAGLCLAVSMVLVLLEGVFGMSTLFLLSLSGFFVGVVIRESGFKMGGVYLAASIALAFFIAPDKTKIITYAVVEIYIFAREAIWELMTKGEIKDAKRSNLLYFLSKLAVFNLLTSCSYIPYALPNTGKYKMAFDCYSSDTACVVCRRQSL